jgi:hypothetical protein
VTGRVAATIGATLGCLAVGLAAASAQVNIDQGKTPAQIFANDCAACHKATRGLGGGKNSFLLTNFLREHYTSSREEAASLAADVLGAGGNDAPARAQKPGQPGQAGQPGQPGQPAAAADRAKPEPSGRAAAPAAPSTAKLQEPKSEEEPNAGRREPVSGSRSHRKEPEASPTAAQEPAPAMSEPPPAASAAVSPAASAPSPAEPGETAPVPRDDIPD